MRYALPILLTAIITLAPARGAEVSADQRQVALGYERLETLALRIADAVESDDPLRAEQLRTAVGQARTGDVAGRFGRVVALLEQERYESARRDQGELAGQLEELLRLVMADPREARLEEERQRLELLQRELRAAVREQRALRERAQREPNPDVLDRQKELAERIERLRDPAAEADRLAGRTEPPADASERPSDSAAVPPEAGAPSIAGKLGEAGRAMQAAGEKLAGGNDPGEDQRDAQRRLEEAQREAEERLRQLREEERQRRLATLAERLRRMHEAQVAIADEAAAQFDGEEAPDGRAARLAAAQLGVRQGEVADAAERALRLVRADGASLAFDEALGQALDDMRTAERRLRDGRLDATALAIARGVVDALAEMIAAVDESLDELERQNKQSSPSAAAAAGESPLVSRIAELRMIRSIQARLLRQTTLWADASRRGEATGTEAATESARLAAEQGRLARAAAALARPVP